MKSCLAMALLGLFAAGCAQCADQSVTRLFAPQDTEGLEPSGVNISQMEVGITCLDSTVVAVNDHYVGVDGDLRGASGNIDYGDYLAAAFIVRDAAGLQGLIDEGCIAPLARDVDFDAQTLVILTVRSDAGCYPELDFALFEDEGGSPYLDVTVSWAAGGDCGFRLERGFVVDTVDLFAAAKLHTRCVE